jgi:DNA-binding NarL/FixJ family response regulator
MDGHHLVEQLRGILPDARVILVSGYDEHSVLGDGTTPEDVAFLAKPFAPSDLHATVRAVLDGRPAPAIAPRAGRDRAA